MMVVLFEPRPTRWTLGPWARRQARLRVSISSCRGFLLCIVTESFAAGLSGHYAGLVLELPMGLVPGGFLPMFYVGMRSDGFGAGLKVPMGLVPDVKFRWGWCRTTSSDGVGAGLQGYEFPDGVGAGIELMKPQRTTFGMHRWEGLERVHGFLPKV